MARIAESLPDNCQQIADDCRKLPQYIDISRDIDISRNRDKGRNEGERELYELFPDGFEISKPKIIPTLSEVVNLCKSLKTRNINPEEFYRHFWRLLTGAWTEGISQTGRFFFMRWRYRGLRYEQDTFHSPDR